MADLATGGSFVGAELRHALVELSLMGIIVATGAVEGLPVIDNRRFGLELSGFLVAFGAGYRDVAASQRKSSLLMLGQGEG